VILELSERKSRLLVVAIAFLTAAVLSFFGIRAALATYYANLGTRAGFETAVRLEPHDPRKWYLFGHYLQTDEVEADPRRAIAAYKTSLDLDPLSADTWLDLAEAYEAEFAIDDARKAFLEANHVYPASSQVHWRYANFLVRQNELESAFSEFRKAIEKDPQLGGATVRICRHYEPDFNHILDEVLPPIAEAYLNVLWELTDEADTSDGLKVWSKLFLLHPKMNSRDVIHFVDGLLREKHTSEAAIVWPQAAGLMDLPKMEDPAGSLIWDGGFETNVIDGGLAWRFDQKKSVLIGYDQEIKHSGARALRLDVDQKDIFGFVGVCQWVVVEPKTAYEFSGWLRTREMADEGGIFFRVRTLGLQTNLTSDTAKLSGTTDWTRVSMPWTTPDEARLAQVCLARPQVYDSRHGIAWVDDVTLLKLGPTAK
jgi:tetratricopeptide (TPR) repeat protein